MSEQLQKLLEENRRALAEREVLDIDRHNKVMAMLAEIRRALTPDDGEVG